MKLKSVLLAISLSAGGTIGCASLPSWAPTPPQGVQYGAHADVNPPGFYGVHTKTKARVYKSFDDPEMKGAQCVDAGYYRRGEAWLKDLKKSIRENCK